MTDYSELVERMRAYPANRLCIQIANALEAQAQEIAAFQDTVFKSISFWAHIHQKQERRIAELEAANAKLRAAIEPVSLWSFETQDGTPAIKELHDDIMRIRAALKGEK